MAASSERAKFERLVFFSDAVFAIAMTLLVIDVRVPRLANPGDERALAQALLDLIPNYIGFVVSFVVIARFWMGHHRLMGLLDEADPTLVRANLALLMAIAFMPFPTAVLSDYATTRVAVGVYTGYLVVAGLANVRLNRVALAGRRRLHPDWAPGDGAALARSKWTAVIIGATGFAVGMVSPIAGLVAMVVGTPLLLPLLGRWRDRKAPRG